MPSRLLILVAFASIFFASGTGSAQEGIAEIPIPQNELGIAACGAYGQAYFSLSGDGYSILRASLNESGLTFRLPDNEYPDSVAPYAAGVNVLTARLQPEKKRIIYHFDNLGNLVARHFVSTDLDDTMMATTSSGATILVGRYRASQNDDWEYPGIVLNADDQVVSRFKLPLPPAGGGWSFGPSDHLLMRADERDAYVLLHSDEPLETEIATISENGKISVTPLPEPISDDHHDYTRWLLGPGVVVEMYDLVKAGRLVGGPFHHFDEYDMRSGKKIATKTAHMGSAHPFTAACYYGDSLAGLGGSRDAQDGSYLRLRIAKLQ